MRFFLAFVFFSIGVSAQQNSALPPACEKAPQLARDSEKAISDGHDPNIICKKLVDESIRECARFNLSEIASARAAKTESEVNRVQAAAATNAARGVGAGSATLAAQQTKAAGNNVDGSTQHANSCLMHARLSSRASSQLAAAAQNSRTCLEYRVDGRGDALITECSLILSDNQKLAANAAANTTTLGALAAEASPVSAVPAKEAQLTQSTKSAPVVKDPFANQGGQYFSSFPSFQNGHIPPKPKK